MDDALLDDDEYKDEEMDDELDEAALLGLSDDEVLDTESNDRTAGDSCRNEQSSDDRSKELCSSVEEDILEVNVDADLDSFIQDDAETSYITEQVQSRPSSRELKYKENLISITLIPSEKTSNQNKKEGTEPVAYSNYSEDEPLKKSAILSDDEESEDEEVEDDHRERFKSERSNIITLTPANKRADIPDSLESVLLAEDRMKAQTFLENQKKKKGYSKNRNFVKEKVGNSQMHHSNVFPVQNVGSHRIHINPHFGKNVPHSAALPKYQEMHNFPSSVVQPNLNFQNQNVNFSVNNPPFSSGEMFFPTQGVNHFPGNPTMQHSENIKPPSSGFRQYGNMPSQFSPTPHTSVGENQPASYVWNHPPPMSVSSSHHSNLSSIYTSACTVPAFSSPNYRTSFESQMQPPIVKQEPFIPIQPWLQSCNKSVHTLVEQNLQVPHPSSLHSANRNQQNLNPQVPLLQQPLQQQHFVQRKTVSQLHVRKLLKRSATFARKELAKQIRLDDGQKKGNFSVRKPNSNIKEIPLVENLPPVQKSVEVKKESSPNDEDEKTKELRMKIEEQKKLREQIIKRKEERRREMALQRRLQDSKNKNGTAQQSTIAKTDVASLASPKKQIIPEILLTTDEVNSLHKAQPPAEVKTLSIHQRIGFKNISSSRIKASSDSPQEAMNYEVPNEKKIGISDVAKISLTNKNPKQFRVKKEVAYSNTEIPFSPSKKMGDQYILSQPSKSPIMHHDSSMQHSAMRKMHNIQERKRFFHQVSKRLPQVPLDRGPPNQNIMNQSNWMDSPVPSPANFPLQPFERNRFENAAQQNSLSFLSPPGMRQQAPFLFSGPRAPFLEQARPPGNFSPPRRFDGPIDNYHRSHSFFLPPFRPIHQPDYSLIKQPFPNLRGPTDMSFNRQRYMHPPPNYQFRHQSRNQFMKKKETSSSPKRITTGNCENKVAEKIATKHYDNSKGNQPSTEKDSYPQTKTVVVNNLSSSTTKEQLQNLGSIIGPIEVIQLHKDDRKAVITFSDPAHACKFQMKYQRYMLDLAMIEVSLQMS